MKVNTRSCVSSIGSWDPFSRRPLNRRRIPQLNPPHLHQEDICSLQMMERKAFSPYSHPTSLNSFNAYPARYDEPQLYLNDLPPVMDREPLTTNLHVGINPAANSPLDHKSDSTLSPVPGYRPKFADLRIYPIKSCRGTPIKKSFLTKCGIDFNRIWMFVDAGTLK